jgi:trans-aconitate 2-methyltransferase
MEISFKYWLDQWELQQNMLIEKREERFDVMFDLTEALYGKHIKALDLGCGPGSLDNRFIDRFPDSQITGIDYDPVLLEIAKNTVYSKNIKYMELDLNSEGWCNNLKPDSFDVVYTTTALHWLPKDSLLKVYSAIRKLLKSDGIFLNGDHFYPDDMDKNADKAYNYIKNMIEKNMFEKTHAMDWDQWWLNLRQTGWNKEGFTERDRRYSTGKHDMGVTLNQHVEYLTSAGFNKIDFPWKYLYNLILMASL